MTSRELGFLLEEDLRKKAGARDSYSISSRIRMLWFVLVLVFVVFVVRLFWLQVVQGGNNRLLSDENRVIARNIPAPRGVIFDRKGRVLVQNTPIFRMENDCSVFEKELADDCPNFVFLSREQMLEKQVEGVSEDIETLIGRSYLFGPAISHVVGYVGEVDERELSNHPDYMLGDLVGKFGIEYQLDSVIRGVNGAELVEVDAFGEVVREVAKREPIAGKDVTLSIDVKLQEKAFELMDNREGALVVIDPNSGEVLALVSSPSFDPNEVAVSLNRDDKPFFNRAFSGLYPPGSVFKIVTSTAGIEDGKIDRNSEFEDTGEIFVGPYRYGNWYFDQYGRKDGWLNLIGALKRSNDIYFYRVGELVGAERLSYWAKIFGYGRRTGIDLPGEVEGLVPSPEWKENIRGERWFLGNTYHFAIGQSDLQTTPLQVAQMTSVVASGGELCRPHVVGSKREDVGENCERIAVNESTLEAVVEGMVAVCESGGTAFPFFDFAVESEGEKKSMSVACKTGTSEFGDPKDRTHAWFTVFAPSSDPKIVVTVLLEKAGEGSYEAAPVAKEFLKYYFEEVSE